MSFNEVSSFQMSSRLPQIALTKNEWPRSELRIKYNAIKCFVILCSPDFHSNNDVNSDSPLITTGIRYK